LIQAVFSTMLQVIVPLAIPVTAGVLLVRFKGLEIKHLLTFVLYFLMPGIVFYTMYTARITFKDLYGTVLFSLLDLVLLWALARAAGKILKLPAPEIAGVTLIST
jgi:predicted permease